MSIFNDDTGKASMMRKVTWFIILTSLAWGTVEILAYIIFAKYGIEFDVHETLILTTLSLGLTGKGVQKAIENRNNNRNGDIFEGEESR